MDTTEAMAFDMKYLPITSSGVSVGWLEGGQQPPCVIFRVYLTSLILALEYDFSLPPSPKSVIFGSTCCHECPLHHGVNCFTLYAEPLTLSTLTDSKLQHFQFFFIPCKANGFNHAIELWIQDHISEELRGECGEGL